MIRNEGTIPPIEERLEHGIRALFRNGKSARDIVASMRAKSERYKNITVADVEPFKAERVVDYIDGERVEHLPFTPYFAERIRTLLAASDATPEQVLEYYRNKKGHSALELRDIEYLAPACKRGPNGKTFWLDA